MKKGWEVKKLGEVCEFINRGISPRYTEDNGLCVLNQKCIRDHKINYKFSRIHDNKIKPVSDEKLISIGDVLVNSTGTGTLGRVAQVHKIFTKSTVDSHITIVRPINNLFHNDFFGYALIAIEEEIALKGEGCGGQTELARNTLKNDFNICYPKSLPEQQRIVAILDEAFAAIAKAKENAEKSLKNARELFESYLENVNAKKELLGKLVDIATGKLDANAATENGQYPFFTCSREVFAIDRYAFDCEAILLAGNNAGGDFNVKHYQGKFNAYQRTYIITVNKESRILYRYLYYQLLRSLKEFKKQSVGVGTKFLKLGMIKSLNIALPSLLEQRPIVAKLDALSAETKKLEAIYQKKLADLEELKKSLLHKAFEGELTEAP